MTTPVPPPPAGGQEPQSRATPSLDVYSPSDAEHGQRNSAQQWAIAAAVGIVIGVVGTLGVQALIGATGSNQVLTKAIEECELEDTSGIRLEDGGKTITFDSKGEDDVIGAGYVDVYCLFEELEMPTSISSHIGQTTSMDGRQTETWNGIEVSWSYHPKRGLDGLLALE